MSDCIDDNESDYYHKYKLLEEQKALSFVHHLPVMIDKLNSKKLIFMDTLLGNTNQIEYAIIQQTRYRHSISYFGQVYSVEHHVTRRV